MGGLLVYSHKVVRLIVDCLIEGCVIKIIQVKVIVCSRAAFDFVIKMY